MKIDRGDVVRVCLNPTEGRELQGDYRPCLVLTDVRFNRLGLAAVAPITQGGNFARFQGFAVPLAGSGMDTQGVVMVNAIRTLDLVARKAKKVEVAPDYIIDDVLARVSALFE